MQSGRRWILRTILEERRTLERARRCFVRDPSEECLHDVRTTGRRLRSLLEDASDLVARPGLLRKIKRAAKITDAARDATILLALLDASVDEGDRAHVQPLVEELARRQSAATKTARRELRKMRFV